MLKCQRTRCLKARLPCKYIGTTLHIYILVYISYPLSAAVHNKHSRVKSCRKLLLHQVANVPPDLPTKTDESHTPTLVVFFVRGRQTNHSPLAKKEKPKPRGSVPRLTGFHIFFQKPCCCTFIAAAPEVTFFDM